MKIELMFYMGSFFFTFHSIFTCILMKRFNKPKGTIMKKKFFVAIFVVVIVLMGLMGTGCKKQAWNTRISSGNWVMLKTNKGEVIYNGPSEFVDDEYELDALTESEFDWIWNHDKNDFDKIKRGSCTFNE